MSRVDTGDRKKTCIVTGSGIAGLAAAIRLSAMGWKVIVLEANEKAGGKISELRLGDFRFDTGASLLTKPEYINDLFKLCGKDPGNFIRFHKLNNLFRFYFTDGSFIDSFADKEKLAEEIGKKCRVPQDTVLRVLKDAENIYALTKEVFLERSLHKARNYFNWPTLRGIFQFRKIRAFESMHQYNTRKLKENRLVQLFDRYASYNGSDPFKAPATLNVISHFEMNEGAYLPEGGMHKITEALVNLALSQGIEIRLRTPADEILIEKGKVTGVRTGEKVIKSDCVVCNTDIHTAYDKLLPGVKRPEFILNQPRSSSVLIFLWGMAKQYPQVKLHTTVFGHDDRAEYEAVFRYQAICDDPGVYIYHSSLLVPGDAPAGKSNLFVMVTAPVNNGQDWDFLTRKTRAAVIKKISALVGEDIEKHIEEEKIINPSDIENNTGAWKGSVYGNSSNGVFSAFLRHPNFSRSVKGLYFCGGSVHPGAGIPLCLLSARIVSDLLAKDFSS